jgi:hypothetical protein
VLPERDEAMTESRTHGEPSWAGGSDRLSRRRRSLLAGRQVGF